MTHLHKQRAAVLITAATLTLALLFTACPNNAGGRTPTPPPAPPTPPPENKTYTVSGVSFTMKGIAAVTNGTVGHADESDNKPHTVSLSAYRIGETEVTQELWQKVMGNNPSHFTSSPQNPVEKVNWYDAIAFCNELTKKVPELGESQCVYTYNGNTYNSTDAGAQREPAINMSKKGFRLPTEAEWEWAAKGGTNDKWAGTNVQGQLVNYAWYSENSGSKTHQVKLKSANGYGLYDMSGNVFEWCWDRYGSLSGTPLPQDYAGAASGADRVLRGGSWSHVADYAARAFRDYSVPGYRHNSLGLRLVSRP